MEHGGVSFFPRFWTASPPWALGCSTDGLALLCFLPLLKQIGFAPKTRQISSILQTVYLALFWENSMKRKTISFPTPPTCSSLHKAVSRPSTCRLGRSALCRWSCRAWGHGDWCTARGPSRYRIAHHSRWLPHPRGLAPYRCPVDPYRERLCTCRPTQSNPRRQCFRWHPISFDRPLLLARGEAQKAQCKSIYLGSRTLTTNTILIILVKPKVETIHQESKENPKQTIKTYKNHDKPTKNVKKISKPRWLSTFNSFAFAFLTGVDWLLGICLGSFSSAGVSPGKSTESRSSKGKSKSSTSASPSAAFLPPEKRMKCHGIKGLPEVFAVFSSGKRPGPRKLPKVTRASKHKETRMKQKKRMGSAREIRSLSERSETVSM